MTEVVAAGDLLGEGPVWDSAEQALYWIDIEGMALRRYRPEGGATATWALAAKPGSVALRAGGGLLLALATGLSGFETETGQLEPLLALEADRPRNRANDGACDRQGRFWVGTMDDAQRQRSGTLYRVDGDLGVTGFRTGMGIPNCPAWSPDGTTLYLAETLDRVVYAHDFDPGAGVPGPPRVFATIPPPGYPDGGTVDADGCLWNAEWDGARLVRYRPDGAVDRVVPLPVSRPTSCAFGGPDLATLYVTTSGQGIDPSLEPLAGSLLAIDPGVRGLPEPRFGD